MVNKRTAARLDTYERRYRELARQLAGIGYIAAGSIALRPARCGKANCACHADPPRLYGPYWHVTQTIDGKTVNRRLTPEQAGLYSEWINNDRRAKELLARVREAAAKAAELPPRCSSTPATPSSTYPSPGGVDERSASASRHGKPQPNYLNKPSRGSRLRAPRRDDVTDGHRPIPPGEQRSWHIGRGGTEAAALARVRGPGCGA